MTVLSFNFLGDGLRDALDPRTRLFNYGKVVQDPEEPVEKEAPELVSQD